MSLQKVETAQDVLVEFMKKMNHWEVTSYELCKNENGGLEKNGNQVKEGLVLIYDQYLTKKERKTGRLAGPDVGYPPEYDLANEKIVATEQLGGGKISIETHWNHPVMKDFSEKRKYLLISKDLISKGTEWRIDKKEVFSPSKGKWVNHVF
jgi:hypothetical protein